MSNTDLFEAVEKSFPSKPFPNPPGSKYLEMQEAHLVKVFPSAQDIFDRYFGADETGDDGGMEHAVVFTEHRGEPIVYKINHPGRWGFGDRNLLQYLDTLITIDELHENRLGLELLGYAISESGIPVVVHKQRFIIGRYVTGYDELADLLVSRGFRETRELYVFKRKLDILRDVHEKNIIVDRSGNAWIIDAILQNWND